MKKIVTFFCLLSISLTANGAEFLRCNLLKCHNPTEKCEMDDSPQTLARTIKVELDRGRSSDNIDIGNGEFVALEYSSNGKYILFSVKRPATSEEKEAFSKAYERRASLVNHTIAFAQIVADEAITGVSFGGGGVLIGCELFRIRNRIDSNIF